MDIFRINERVSPAMMGLFLLRAALLFIGVYLVYKGIVLLWELRPVRKKKYTTVVDAKVTELVREQRSASMNTYFMPRFEYEDDGEVKVFQPKESYRPCRLKLGGDVKLCISEKGKFRTVRKELTLTKAFVILGVGLVLALAQILIHS